MKRLASVRSFQAVFKVPNLNGSVFFVSICLFLMNVTPALAQEWILVDFGSSLGSTQTPYGDWNQVLRDGTYTEFANPDGDSTHDGIKAVSSTPNGTTAYFGIRGITPINFQVGQKIIATFYNPTGSSQDINVRLSVTDQNAPDTSDTGNPWISIYAIGWDGQYSTWISLNPGTLVRAELYVTDSSRVMAPNAGTTAGQRSLVNINLANNNTDVILTQIAFSDEADSRAPTTPSNLVAAHFSPSPNSGQTGVRISWNPSTDSGDYDTGLRAYLIYRDGQLFDSIVDQPEAFLSNMGQSPYYRDVLTEPGQTYTYYVTAIDLAPIGMYPTTSYPTARHGNESSPSNTVSISIPTWQGAGLINPYTDIIFQGSFRMPDSGSDDWGYANRGLTYYPDGAPDYDSATELPGSLFAVQGVPHGERIAEITIPKPVQSASADDLPRSRYLRTPVDIWPAVYNGNTTPPGGGYTKSLGVGYHPAAGGVSGRVYYTVSDMYGTDTTAAVMGAFALDLSQGQGAWHLGTPPENVHPGVLSSIVFSAPTNWASQYTGGRSLIAGASYISGCGVPSAGPSLYAVAPWSSGVLPQNGDSMDYIELLRYGSGGELGHYGINFKYDEFGEGGAWLVDGSSSAIVISNRRGSGDWWYGYTDGVNMSEYNIPAQSGDSDHGTGATAYRARLVFYDPADLAAVAEGRRESWEPVPYSMLDLSQFSINNGGSHAGDIGYDSTNNYIYFIEHNGDPGYPNGFSIIHVFRLQTVPTLPLCPDCGGENVTISNREFGSNTNCRCTATNSITLSDGVTVRQGATMVFGIE